MLGQMMQMPLMISGLIEHADACHGDARLMPSAGRQAAMEAWSTAKAKN